MFTIASVISPGASDHSPNTDYPSEGSLASDLCPPSSNNFGQYSSQDSLPDSPYSSQSLDSQPNNGPGSYTFSAVKFLTA